MTSCDLGWSWAGLKMQECQRNLSPIYTGRNQNSINNIARVKVGPSKNLSRHLFQYYYCKHNRTRYCVLAHHILNNEATGNTLHFGNTPAAGLLNK
jgi:hypothetical protein